MQNTEDRNITPKTAVERHPIIAGESPTTGLAWTGVYLPMLVQISNPEGLVKVNDKTVKAALTSATAPPGVVPSDIAYEGILYRTGGTAYLFPVQR